MAGQAITGNSYTNENIKNLQAQIDRAGQQLKNYNTNRATDEELRKRAESEYTPTYNAQVGEQEAKKQSAQTALNNQLSAIGRQYERDAESIGRGYDQQRVTANNTMLARGFNNSSLALAMLNQVETQRNRALENLAAERSANETSAQGAYNDAVTAADAAIGRLGVDLQTNIDARYQALKDAEEARLMQATEAQNQLAKYQNDLAFQLEQLRQQGYSQYLQEQQMAAEQAAREQAYQQQLAEFELQKQQYADQKAQQAWENTFNENQLAASREQWQKEYEAQQKQQADKLAQQEWENRFNEQQAAANREQQAWENAFNQQQADASKDQWQKEFDFQQKQYADSQKKSSGGSSSKSSGTQAAGTNQPSSSLEDKYNNSGSGKLSSAAGSIADGVKNAASSVASLLGSIVGKASSKKSGVTNSGGSKQTTSQKMVKAKE